MTGTEWGMLEEALSGEALVLAGPGARLPLPPGYHLRHLPPWSLVAVAEGAALARPGESVIALGGDADVYGAGLGDLLHAIRRNAPVTCVVNDNGFASGGAATVGEGEHPIRPMGLALAAGAAFVAQQEEGESLPHLLAEAVQNPGFSLVNLWNRPGELEPMPDDHDQHDLTDALRLSADLEHQYRGIWYHDPERISPSRTDRQELNIEAHWQAILTAGEEGG